MARPNILWLMTDQHHASCLSGEGRHVRTPALDRLAEDGVVFERAYCNNPICAPSRACFLTGQYVHTHGLQGNRVVAWPEPNPNHVGAVFRRAGWRTGLVGKSHLPRHWIEDGFEFIRFCDLCDAWPHDPSTCHYMSYLEENGVEGWYEDGTARPGVTGGLDGSSPADLPYEHSIEAYTGREAIAFLEEGKDDERPFFLKMSFERPHAPMRPAREYFDLYPPDEIELPESAVDWFENRFAGKPQWMIDRLAKGSIYPFAADDPAALKQVLAAYYALITCIDMEIGHVFDWLREHGEYDNTIIVFTADHGDFAGDHGLFHKNFGIFECIHRIPFILRLPNGPKGERRSQIVESIDLFPTFCEAAGLPVPETVEGQSLVPIMRDADAPGKPEALAEWSWFEPIERINALRTDRYRIVYYNQEHGGELYDHRNDPGEVDNLWNDPAHAEVRFELLQRLFDRVNTYRSKLDMRDDRTANEYEKYMPSRVVQFGQKDWGEYKEFLAAPSPVRPNPPGK